MDTPGSGCKITALLPIIILTAIMSALLPSCKTLSDPFLTTYGISFDATGSEEANAVTTAVSTENSSTGNDEGDNNPDKDFYSLTMAESVEKYGLFTFSPRALLPCDGKYMYLQGEVTVQSGDGTTSVKTLCRSDYPGGGHFGPVCTDPLCTHSSAGSCPFAHFDSMFNLACYGGKLYFVSRDGGLYVYTPGTNSTKMLSDNCHSFEFVRCEDRFYIINHEEQEDFSTVAVLYGISKDAKMTEIGRFDDLYTQTHLVCDGRLIVDCGIEETEETQTATVLLRDPDTGGNSAVFEEVFQKPENGSWSETRINPRSIYGDKLLVYIDNTENDPEGIVSFKAEVWLIDLKSGEKQLLTCSSNSSNASLICHSSEKMICTVDERKDENDDLVIRLLDPYTGKETAYDLSEMAASVGKTIALDACLNTLDRFTARLRTTYKIPYSFINGDGEIVNIFKRKTFDTLLFDLESGRVFAYPEPTEEDLSLEGAI